MIVEYIRYKLTSHSPEDLVSAYAKAADHLKAAPSVTGSIWRSVRTSPTA